LAGKNNRLMGISKPPWKSMPPVQNPLDLAI